MIRNHHQIVLEIRNCSLNCTQCLLQDVLENKLTNPKLKFVYWIINETFVQNCFSKTQYCVKQGIKHLSPASQPC